MPFGRRRNRIDRSLRERGVPPEPQHKVREVAATSGPYDEADAPDDGVARIDLGSLRLPALPGMDLRVELSPQQKVIGATLRAGDSLLQVSAFAAPRAAGIWDDVRAELATSASGQGGSLREVDGPFGTELAGTILAPPPPQPGATAPPQPVRRAARFLGVDGPRWFLRGMISGPAAEDARGGAAAGAAFRGIVVARGTEPMPVREQLPLRLPPQAAAQLARQQAAAQPAAGQPAPGQRGRPAPVRPTPEWAAPAPGPPVRAGARPVPRADPARTAPARRRWSVVLHGGFWRAGVRDRARPPARGGSRRRPGFAAVAVEYRRVGAGGGWPATLEDVAAALDCLPELPDAARLDLADVTAMGHSAGGHLAAWLAGAAPAARGRPGRAAAGPGDRGGAAGGRPRPGGGRRAAASATGRCGTSSAAAPARCRSGTPPPIRCACCRRGRPSSACTAPPTTSSPWSRASATRPRPPRRGTGWSCASSRATTWR